MPVTLQVSEGAKDGEHRRIRRASGPAISPHKTTKHKPTAISFDLYRSRISGRPQLISADLSWSQPMIGSRD
jgi:hypothetical protein